MKTKEQPKPARPSGERSGERRDSREGGRDGGRDSRDNRGGGRGPRGGGSSSGGPRGGGRGGFQRRRRRLFGGGKPCPCCLNKIKYVDYKNVDYLQRFVSNQGKILPRRMSGACARHQRMITTAIKRARNIALLPFTA